ncbi:MAG: glycosyltransferase family 2 protein, partial [Phycisphaerales bacterium]|nr:glycosyltransferase family 2 protein [Phycisphaerales bacterium]
MTMHVAAVIPVFNRPDDLRVLLADLASIETSGVRLTRIVVDNASDPPIGVDSGVDSGVELVRLPTNTGGSGGFNAGMCRAVEMDDVEAIWLLDRDVRVPRGTLTALMATMAEGHDVVGAVLCDPATGTPYEFGGRLDRTWGHYASITSSDGPDRPDYIAACCLLVRRDLMERVGGLPDLFLNCDDVAWGVRARRLGASLAVATEARVDHPPGLFPGGARYYQSRNGVIPIDVAGLGGCVRGRRALLEIGRAFGLVLMGRDDLARAHADGLRDAARRLV